MLQEIKMTDLEFVDYIYDPVWKNIPITRLEKKIIESNIFRRLMNIKQMSLTYVAFSGANHTRFEHSIGTMHVAYKVVNKTKNLKEYANNYFITQKKRGNNKFENGYQEVLQFFRIAALLHDLGHPPFSHAIEWVFQRNPHLYLNEKKYSHDEYTRELVRTNKELAKILEGQELITPENLYNFLAKKFDKLPKPIAILSELLDGDLDVDKVDYIIRDNYHCGLPVNLDINSIAESFEIIGNYEPFNEFELDDDEIEMKLKPEMLYVVENLLYARLQLKAVIHNDKKNRIANIMLMYKATQFLENKKNEFGDNLAYSNLIKNLHEVWTDLDFYKEMCYDLKEEERNSDWGIRALKGDIITESAVITTNDISPVQRALCYILEKNRDLRTSLQNKLSAKFGTEMIIDYAMISPPPLKIEVSLDQDEYKLEPGPNDRLTYSLHAISNVIQGILKDSFRNSFVAVYHESNINVDPKDVYQTFLVELENLNVEYRKKDSGNEICELDIVLLSLLALDFFGPNLGENIHLWMYGTKRFQDFIKSFSVKYNLHNKFIDEISEEFSTKFSVLMEKLVFYGIMDKKRKKIKKLFKRDDLVRERYLVRYDYQINEFGKDFLFRCSKEYFHIGEQLLRDLAESKDIYIEYLDALKDQSNDGLAKIKKMKNDIRSRTLPVIGIL